MSQTHTYLYDHERILRIRLQNKTIPHRNDVAPLAGAIMTSLAWQMVTAFKTSQFVDAEHWARFHHGSSGFAPPNSSLRAFRKMPITHPNIIRLTLKRNQWKAIEIIYNARMEHFHPLKLLRHKFLIKVEKYAIFESFFVFKSSLKAFRSSKESEANFMSYLLI